MANNDDDKTKTFWFYFNQLLFLNYFTNLSVNNRKERLRFLPKKPYCKLQRIIPKNEKKVVTRGYGSLACVSFYESIQRFKTNVLRIRKYKPTGETENP